MSETSLSSLFLHDDTVGNEAATFRMSTLIATVRLTHLSKTAKWQQNRLFHFRVQHPPFPSLEQNGQKTKVSPTRSEVLHQRGLFCERLVKVLDGLNSFWLQMRLKLITLFDTCQKTTTVHAMVHSHLKFITRLRFRRLLGSIMGCHFCDCDSY